MKTIKQTVIITIQILAVAGIFAMIYLLLLWGYSAGLAM